MHGKTRKINTDIEHYTINAVDPADKYYFEKTFHLLILMQQKKKDLKSRHLKKWSKLYLKQSDWRK
jgi:hypothetical protein